MPVTSLGVVVARRHSKRLPDKVLRPLLGHPLIAYMARAALASGLTNVILSTEDDEIAKVAKTYGLSAPFRRPSVLANDFAQDHEIALHALDFVENRERTHYDVVVLMQPTTPFVLPSTINACVDGVAGGHSACCFAARPVAEKPHWMFVERPDGSATTLLEGALEGARQHSQNLTPAFLPTGAVWAIRSEELRRQRRIYAEPLRMVIMDRARSIDIDEAIDLSIAEAVGQHERFSLIPVARNRD